jgi:hypothetical protein
LRTPQGVPAAAVELLQSRCASVVLPEVAGLSAWQCDGR